MIVNKKFWDGLPADIRTPAGRAMQDATTYANDIAQKENDDALAAIKKSGKTEIHHADTAGEGGVEEGARAGAQGDGSARRQGH